MSSQTTPPTAEQAAESPAMRASRASWRCVHAHDREGWLALMADDVVIEDPIGEFMTNPDGREVRGREAVAAFYDANIAVNDLSVECEETFHSSSPQEVAHVLTLTSRFDDGLVSVVRGVFAYRTDDAGLLTNLRGWWNMDAMRFTRPGRDGA